MIRKANIEISDDGLVDVKFEGGHLNKRELLRIIKAIKLAHRRNIQEYRKNVMKLNKVKEKENDIRRNQSSERSGSSESTGTVPTTAASEGVVNKVRTVENPRRQQEVSTNSR